MHFTTAMSLFCWTQPSGWVLLILWYTVIDVWLSVMVWSDRRRPNSRSIASLQINTGSMRRNKCSVFKIRRQSITFLLVENEFWVQRHGYETDDLKNNLQIKIFDRKSKPTAVLFDCIEFISLFSNGCPWNRFQALSDRLC